ncbi:MAG TPA: hypothetical protein VFP85_11970 [Vicinamibacterales bacterium]|nr:hypothetical protein [Vicinamibacterales bacterium]
MAGRARISVAAFLFVLGLGAPAAAQGTGILLFTDKEQIPLKAYAEFMRAGILQLTSGSARDIPTIDTFRMLRTSLTGWRPVAVMAASEDLFKSEYSERRMIPIATRPVGVTALAVRVADLEQPNRIRELHSAIQRPEGGEDAYFFLILTSGDMNRYYPFRIRQAAR